jgi:hypothetical protein
MTPKEKAKQLLDRFLPIVRQSDLYDTYYNKAKECALIFVDGIIENNLTVLGGESYFRELNYWKDVKEEIAKL